MPSRAETRFTTDLISPAKAQAPALLSKLLSEWTQILRPLWFVGLLAGVSLAGAVLPFRGQVGPALTLLLIFPLTSHAARWRAKNLTGLSHLAPTSAFSQFNVRMFAAIFISLCLCLPALGRLLSVGQFSQLPDILAIGIGLPVTAMILGHVTRGPVAGRLILLILWYGYLNMGPSPLG